MPPLEVVLGWKFDSPHPFVGSDAPEFILRHYFKVVWKETWENPGESLPLLNHLGSTPQLTFNLCFHGPLLNVIFIAL